MQKKVLSDLDSLINLRNTINNRLLGFRADVIYWEEIFKQEKPDTQKRVDAKKIMQNQKGNVKKDEAYLKIIDEMIAEETHKEKQTEHSIGGGSMEKTTGSSFD